MNHAVIDMATNKVINTSLWDGVTDWSPGEGLIAVEAPEGVGIGWSYIDGQFIAPPAAPPFATLAEAKAARLDALAARRKGASQAFTFNGMSLRLDADTENAISKAIQALERQPEGTTISWEVSRGVIVPFDLATLHAIGDAAFLHVQACFTNVATITALINAAETVEAVQAVDLQTGWPA